jgi:hypothetical protein
MAARYAVAAPLHGLSERQDIVLGLQHRVVKLRCLGGGHCPGGVDRSNQRVAVRHVVLHKTFATANIGFESNPVAAASLYALIPASSREIAELRE